MALTQDRTGTYMIWGKKIDEEVDRNFKVEARWNSAV